MAAEACIDPTVFDVEQSSAGELHMLSKAMARLSRKKREAFVLMALFELSASETGKILGTFANTAASRYRHARADLEEIYKDQNQFDGLTANRTTKEAGLKRPD